MHKGNVIVDKMVLLMEGMDKKVFPGLHGLEEDLDILQGSQEDMETHHMQTMMLQLNKNTLLVPLRMEMQVLFVELVLLVMCFL